MVIFIGFVELGSKREARALRPWDLGLYEEFALSITCLLFKGCCDNTKTLNTFGAPNLKYDLRPRPSAKDWLLLFQLSQPPAINSVML